MDFYTTSEVVRLTGLPRHRLHRLIAQGAFDPLPLPGGGHAWTEREVGQLQRLARPPDGDETTWGNTNC